MVLFQVKYKTFLPFHLIYHDNNNNIIENQIHLNTVTIDIHNNDDKTTI